MNNQDQYDYIIAGAGLAGLSLVMHIIESRRFDAKRILIVDKEEKTRNDRTWCFWEKENGLFQNVVHKQWKDLMLYNNGVSKALDIYPYQYKLIRGIDFYTYCFQKIRSKTNIHFLTGEIQKIESGEQTYVLVNGRKIYAQYIFNSTYQKPALNKDQYWLLQHFKGWFIETSEPVFNSGVATLMDFRASQSNGTTFFYVLPFSSTEALIEYTLFSPHLLDEEVYEMALQKYVSEILGIQEFQIREKEFGVIPMTNYIFPKHQHNIINIGTAGGQTKGSSGYTFQFIQKHSAAIVQSVLRGEHPAKANTFNSRFHFYDSVLLNILYNKTLPGDKIFTRLFQKNKASKVFSFLDNETSLADDINIISTLPTLPFTKAAMQQIF